MALPAKPLDDIVAMDKERLEEYLMEFAQYMEDSPNKTLRHSSGFKNAVQR